MAETSSFDKKLLAAKLDAVEKTHKEYVGKRNYNPFFILHRVADLRKQLERGNTSPELAKAINELPTEVKPLDPTATEETKPTAAKPTLTPKGLDLKDKQ